MTASSILEFDLRLSLSLTASLARLYFFFAHTHAFVSMSPILRECDYKSGECMCGLSATSTWQQTYFFERHIGSLQRKPTSDATFYCCAVEIGQFINISLGKWDWVDDGFETMDIHRGKVLMQKLFLPFRNAELSWASSSTCTSDTLNDVHFDVDYGLELFMILNVLMPWRWWLVSGEVCSITVPESTS